MRGSAPRRKNTLLTPFIHVFTNALVGLIGVITVPAVLLTLTLIYKSARGMGELNHDQERVGRPSLTLPCPILGEYRRYHCRQDLALSALTLLIVHSRCDLPRA